MVKKKSKIYHLSYFTSIQFSGIKYIYLCCCSNIISIHLHKIFHLTKLELYTP